MEPIFSCTQEEEILTAKSCWTSCLSKQSRFVAFSPRYTTDYINGKLTFIQTAAALPNEQQRQLAESTARIQLVDINTDACANWQLLKRYIAKAYPANLQQTNWNAAGMTYYEAASNENWESASTLMRLGNEFITSNLAALTANDNMPDTFQETFDNSTTAFNNKLTAFITAEQTNKTGAETKITALNTVHTELMEMCLDGQEIFRTADALRALFVYEQVLALYAGKGAQGYKGLVKDETTGLPIKGVTITVVGTVHSDQSDASGKYKMQNVAHAENQTITAEHPDYQTKTIPGNTVEIGVMTTLDISLTPNP